MENIFFDKEKEFNPHIIDALEHETDRVKGSYIVFSPHHSIHSPGKGNVDMYITKDFSLKDLEMMKTFLEHAIIQKQNGII